LSVCLVAGVLYLGKAFLLPIALSVLLAFLLAPLVGRLEALRLGRAASVTIVAALTFAAIGLILYVVAVQLVDLVSALPGYRDNINRKVFAPLNHVTAAFTSLLKSFQPADNKSAGDHPLPVQVITGKLTVLGVIREFAGPIFSPIATAAIVIVNVVFFLYDRKGLRDRFIYLVGRGRLHITTQAIDDAADRVSRYLGAQLMVNSFYGVPIGLGLYLIGIPNAALWGLLAIALRFVPYIGTWIAALFPVALSLAIAPTWTPLLETLALFIAVELISCNLIEPWLYGASTGLSPSAIIVAATFWTWLWGAGGLLLATPLTVCLAVLGKYVPALAFLDILLGERPPIAPEHRFYQRLLAGDRAEVDETVVHYLDRNAPEELFDQIILPALQMAEQDVRSGCLESDDLKEVWQSLRAALGDIDGFRFVDDDEIRTAVLIPARTEGDALAAAMLYYLLHRKGLACTLLSERTLNSEAHTLLAERPEATICLSALTPASARAAASLFKRLTPINVGAKILGVWHGDRALAIERLDQPEIEVASSLNDAVRVIASSAPARHPGSRQSQGVGDK
jgi:predicted PurR-regulated permease PerM